jgi:hypothetical protein
MFECKEERERTYNFVPFLYRYPGKLGFLAHVALYRFNNLPRINRVNSSTPAASTIYNYFILSSLQIIDNLNV